MSSRILFILSALAALFVIAGCGDDDESGDNGEPEPSAASAEDCTPEGMDTLKPGVLTVATDKPAYPPYFEDNDPTNGKGFESAVAYAIANELGFSQPDVEWTVVPFNASYAPGPKDFDFDVNQISITPKREESVDFSTPYYTAKQAVVALKDSDAASATSLADLQSAKIGVQIGTTSLDAVQDLIDTDTAPLVFDTSNDVVNALKNGQVDAVVVDVPTAFYLTAAQVPEATTVGQFSAPGGDEWGALLEKDSPLTACIEQAVNSLKQSGALAHIEQIWIANKTNAPVIE